MELRAFTESDALDTMRVFARAIRETAAHDYTPEQVEAWAAGAGDRETWTRRRTTANTQLAELGGHVVGFIDVDEHGYIDMLFVDPDVSRTGVATSLLAWAEATARGTGGLQLSTHASITARAFFEARGFVVHEERAPVVRGVVMTNFRMTRPL